MNCACQSFSCSLMSLSCCSAIERLHLEQRRSNPQGLLPLLSESNRPQKVRMWKFFATFGTLSGYFLLRNESRVVHYKD